MVEPEHKSNSPYKTCAHSQMIILWIWWNRKGMLYYKLLPRGITITADIILLPTTETSCRRNPRKTTKRLHEVMQLHDYVRPHSSILTKNTIQELGSEVIPHPPYSPNLAPSDFHISRSLSNNLQGTLFLDENILRTLLDYFNSNPRDFYRRGIEKLLQHWQTVVNCEGEYIVEC